MEERVLIHMFQFSKCFIDSDTFPDYKHSNKFVSFFFVTSGFSNFARSRENQQFNDKIWTTVGIRKFKVYNTGLPSDIIISLRRNYSTISLSSSRLHLTSCKRRVNYNWDILFGKFSVPRQEGTSFLLFTLLPAEIYG